MSVDQRKVSEAVVAVMVVVLQPCVRLVTCLVLWGPRKSVHVLGLVKGDAAARMN